MSEGRLDTSNKSNLTHRVMWLLTRHIAAQPCPLDKEELAAFYDSALGVLSEQHQIMYRAAKAIADGKTSRLPLYRPSMTGIPVKMFTGHKLMFQIDGGQLWNDGCPVLSVPSSLNCMVPLAKIDLPSNKLLDFEEWALRAAETGTKVANSLHLAEKLISMANTAGQLDRMCPEFLRYINDDGKRKHAANQMRRSPFPDGWEDLDRAHLRAMVNHLAVCSLAAANQIRNNTTVSDVMTGSVWMFEASIRGMMHSSAQPSKTVTPLLSQYDPVTGQWSTPA